MSLHYLNPDDEPRECPGCLGQPRTLDEPTTSGSPRQRRRPACSQCNGTGRLGVEGKGPDVEVKDNGYGVWRWRWHQDAGVARSWAKCAPGTFDSESAALEAARAAHRCNNATRDPIGGHCLRPPGHEGPHSGYYRDPEREHRNPSAHKRD